MPCLIPEILFDIGKKLIEDGDLESRRNSEGTIIRFGLYGDPRAGKQFKKFDATIRLGLLGRESLKALKNVFFSLKTFKIYYYYIVIGWGKQCYVLDFNVIPKCLFYSIGESVKTLFIYRKVNPILQPIMDKIIAKKQLQSFSAGNETLFYISQFLNEFLPLFSTTLKDLSVPTQLLLDSFCTSLRPSTLALYSNNHKFLPGYLFQSTVTQERLHKFFLSVENLSFDVMAGRLYNSFTEFKNAIMFFPSLEILQFYVKFYRNPSIRADINALIKFIQRSTNTLSKAVYILLNSGHLQYFVVAITIVF